jgi:hypothetical protein
MKIIDVNLENIDKEQAQNSITPFTTYSLYYNGKFITHEIVNDKKFDDLLIKKFIVLKIIKK